MPMYSLYNSLFKTLKETQKGLNDEASLLILLAKYPILEHGLGFMWTQNLSYSVL